MSELVSIHRGTPGALRSASIGAGTFARPTPERPLIISASELRDFLRCRVRWHWRHRDFQQVDFLERVAALDRD